MKSGFLQSYNRDVEVMSLGERGCLVSFKTGRLAGGFTPVPYDSISWKSSDWFEEDKPIKREIWK